MYSDTDILAAIDCQHIKISPYNQEQLQANSYDVRLGNTFYEVFWDSKGPYFVGPYVYLDGERVYIPISGTILGITKESVGTSGKVVAELRSESTTRRKGITTNCDAGLGDIGYNNIWTLELTAFISNSLAIELLIKVDDWLTRNGFGISYLSKVISRRKNDRPFLTVGECIAQMVFHECKSEPTREYDGQYQADWPLNMIPKEYRHRVRSIK